MVATSVHRLLAGMRSGCDVQSVRAAVLPEAADVRHDVARERAHAAQPRVAFVMCVPPLPQPHAMLTPSAAFRNMREPASDKEEAI
jgi:hypothetical protein